MLWGCQADSQRGKQVDCTTVPLSAPHNPRAKNEALFCSASFFAAASTLSTHINHQCPPLLLYSAPLCHRRLSYLRLPSPPLPPTRWVTFQGTELLCTYCNAAVNYGRRKNVTSPPPPITTSVPPPFSPLPLLHQSAFSAIAACALKRYDASRRGAIDVAAAKQCLQASTIAFIYWATSMPPTANFDHLYQLLAPARLHHTSHPPMHRYLPLWLSLQYIICVCLRLMKNQKNI